MAIKRISCVSALNIKHFYTTDSSLEDYQKKDINRVFREIEAHMRCRDHRNLVELYDVYCLQGLEDDGNAGMRRPDTPAALIESCTS